MLSFNFVNYTQLLSKAAFLSGKAIENDIRMIAKLQSLLNELRKEKQTLMKDVEGKDAAKEFAKIRC